MNKTQISQMPDEELIEAFNTAVQPKPSEAEEIGYELADRLEIRNGDLESKRAHEQTMAEVRAKVDELVSYYSANWMWSRRMPTKLNYLIEALRDE